MPSGSRIRVDYTDPAAPVLAVKVQEVFGWPAHPGIADGRVPVLLHLLSPAGRPVAVTADLAVVLASPATRGPRRAARPLPAPPVAGGPGHGDAHPARHATRR